MLCDSRRHQRMCDLEQERASAAEQEGLLATHSPRHSFGIEVATCAIAAPSTHFVHCRTAAAALASLGDGLDLELCYSWRMARTEPKEPVDPTPSLSGIDSEVKEDRTRADKTGALDIRYYRDSALARRLATQAAARGRRARREAMVLIPLVAGILVLWHFREDLFGTDTPVRIAAALLLTVVGWRFARDLGRLIGPRLLSRTDPGTAATVAFAVQLVTVLIIGVIALRLVDLEPRAIALGGAVTAIVLGLAAQSTIGNLIAGIVLLTARPFRVGERVRLQAGALAGELEGTVVSLGLIYTTLARGEERILVPNNTTLGASILPLRRPAGVDLRAYLRPDVKPSDVQRLLLERVRTPTRDDPDIALEEVRGEWVRVRISATPVSDTDGSILADEVLAALSEHIADNAPDSSSVPSGTA
jgi:small conductance mechanosensitive channel